MNLAEWLDMFFIVAGVIVFAAIMLATFWPSRRDAIERDGQIPFHDNT